MWLSSLAKADYNLEAHNIINRFESIQGEFDAYKKKSEKEIDDLWVKLSKVRLDRDETLKKLKQV